MTYDEFIAFIISEKNNNHLSHAYLIETNDIDDINPIISSFVKTIFHNGDASHDKKVDLLIDDNNLPDLKIINPMSTSNTSNGNSVIDIETIRELISSFSNTSFSEDYEVYVITDASKLNGPSSNTLLKFLEEPNSNTIGILMCKNRYTILDTLISRCQVISIKNEKEFVVDSSNLQILLTLFSQDKGFLVYNDIIELLPDKSSFNNFLLVAEKYFFEVVNGKTELDSQLLYLKDKLYKIIIIIEKYLKNNNYNVGYKLILDNFLVDIEEVI